MLNKKKINISVVGLGVGYAHAKAIKNFRSINLCVSSQNSLH